MARSSRLPLDELQEAEVVEYIETPYDECDPEPTRSLGVEVRLRTTRGVVTSPRHLQAGLHPTGDQLAALLPGGITAGRRTEYSVRRRPALRHESRTWWRVERVAKTWKLSTVDARMLALRLKVRTFTRSAGATPYESVTVYEPYAVQLIAEQFADGTVARYAVSVLLEQLDRVGAPGEQIALPYRERRAGELFFDSSVVGLLRDAELTSRFKVLRRLLEAWGHTHSGDRDPGELPAEIAAYLDYVRYSLCCAARREALPARVPPPTSRDCPDGPWTAPPGMPTGDELAARVRRALADRPVVRLRRNPSP
jgi:hypothetical protein